MKRSNGFTLVEVVVAIGIIMLLASLLMGGLNAAMRRARKTRARRSVALITTAWKAYYADNRRFPDASFSGEASVEITEMNAVAIQILRGPSGDDQYDDPEYQAKNPREQEYMDFHKAVTEYLDPWDNPYRIILDDEGGAGYDGVINVPTLGGGGTEDVRQSVAVYSIGPDGEVGTADDVCSWRDR
jgi:general secretion pathway protein G